MRFGWALHVPPPPSARFLSHDDRASFSLFSGMQETGDHHHDRVIRWTPRHSSTRPNFPFAARYHLSRLREGEEKGSKQQWRFSLVCLPAAYLNCILGRNRGNSCRVLLAFGCWMRSRPRNEPPSMPMSFPLVHKWGRGFEFQL